MRVAAEREGGRVMPEGTAELEQVGPFAQVDRGERVAERVKRCPGRAGLLYQGLEDPAAEVVGVDHLALDVGESRGGRVPVLLGQVSPQSVDEWRRQADIAPAVFRLRRLDATFDDRPPDADLGR